MNNPTHTLAHLIASLQNSNLAPSADEVSMVLLEAQERLRPGLCMASVLASMLHEQKQRFQTTTTEYQQ